jgi:periplasmic protein TonB
VGKLVPENCLNEATCRWFQALALVGAAAALGMPGSARALREAGSAPEAYDLAPEGRGPLGGYQLLPRYPDSARRQGITGTTTLLFEVLENGRVGEVQIENSAGHPDLDQAAADAIKKWRFEPARRGNQPVAVWLRMPVKFVLR